LEDLCVDGRIILNLILNKWNVMKWTEFIWLRIGTGGGSSEHGNELPDSIKGRGFLTS